MGKKDVAHLQYTIEYYSAIKNNEIMPFAATWMDLQIIILSEVSQIEKDKYHMISFNMWNLKYDTNELIYNLFIETDSETQKTDLRLPKGKGGGGWINQEFGISRHKLLYIKQINNKVLLYSIGNDIQYPVINWNGKEYEEEYVYLCITESLCCTLETNTTL